MAFQLTDDARVRAMVALLEAQAAQVVALRRSVETLEGRLALRNALDTVVADEVQQGMADLRMALSALRRLPQADRQAEWLTGEASRRVEQLAERIGELLAPAPLSDPKVEREAIHEVAFVEVLDRALDAVPGLDAERVACLASADLQVSTAPARLAAVLAALLDNAVRHGGDASIRCDAELVFGDLVVRVADDGPGLGGTDPEDLFPAFASGTGCGLYVARMLARSLGGDVTLAERPEGGVVASVVMPQRRDDDAAPRTMREIAADW
jgi:two-component system sensor histidine kinase KdpD